MNSVQDDIRSTLARHRSELEQLARQIHENPELGLEETRACAWHVELLRAWGFLVETPFAGLNTAYKAVTGDGDPTFCFMAEYDALRGLGHGCGHNLIGAAAVGAGKALAETLQREGIPGTVVVMGTPAEEGRGGKVMMLAQDALAGIDAVMLAHPRSRTMPDTGSSAIARFEVSFRGRSAHAAAAPEEGQNALDAVMLTFQGINAWRQHLPEACRVHGIIDDGGETANTIPDHASSIIYLRAMEDGILEGMVRRLHAIAEGAALMTETVARVEKWGEGYRARVPNAPLNEAWMEASAKAGLDPGPPSKPNRASSDFGDVSQLRPGAHVYFGISEEHIPVHSVAFREAAGSEFGMDRMLRAAEALAVAGHRYISEPAFRERVHDNFRDAMG